jgi:(p)ppGpp synthase/HD superfamily hydrolase
MEDTNFCALKFQPCQYSDKLISLLESLNKIAARPVDIREIKKACYYARKYHGTQLRKSGEPYYSHPIEVACLFAKYAGKYAGQYYTTTLIIVAILHDTLEDTELTKEMIAAIFGQNIADKVEDLTRIKIDKKISAAETLNILFVQDKIDLLYIKMFDRLHNMQTIGAMKPEKMTKISKETATDFVSLAKELNIYDIANELSKLSYEATSLSSRAAFRTDDTFWDKPHFSILPSNLIKWNKPKP